MKEQFTNRYGHHCTITEEGLLYQAEARRILVPYGAIQSVEVSWRALTVIAAEPKEALSIDRLGSFTFEFAKDDAARIEALVPYMQARVLAAEKAAAAVLPAEEF